MACLCSAHPRWAIEGWSASVCTTESESLCTQAWAQPCYSLYGDPGLPAGPLRLWSAGGYRGPQGPQGVLRPAQSSLALVELRRQRERDRERAEPGPASPPAARQPTFSESLSPSPFLKNLYNFGVPHSVLDSFAYFKFPVFSVFLVSASANGTHQAMTSIKLNLLKFYG